MFSPCRRPSWNYLTKKFYGPEHCRFQACQGSRLAARIAAALPYTLGRRPDVWQHIVRTPANFVDALAFLLLIPLALTSSAHAKRWLGG